MTKLISVLIVCLMLCGCYEVGKGNKIGTITRLNHEGLIFKTYEAQMIRGGMTDGSGSFGQTFNFTIERPELVDIIQTALDKQQKIKIYYHQELITWCRSDSSNAHDGDNYFLDSVEILN